MRKVFTDQDYQSLAPIMGDDCDKKVLKSLLDQTVSQAVAALGSEYAKMSLDQLIIIRYFQILKNPYHTFEFKLDEPFDFHKFYENLEKSEPKELV